VNPIQVRRAPGAGRRAVNPVHPHGWPAPFRGQRLSGQLHRTRSGRRRLP